MTLELWRMFSSGEQSISFTVSSSSWYAFRARCILQETRPSVKDLTTVTQSKPLQKPTPPPPPAWPGSGLFAVRKDHLVVVGDVALDEVECADRHRLGNQVGTETVAAIKGHEEAERPKVVRLVVLLRLLSH